MSDTLPDLDTLIKEATSDRLRVGTHTYLGVLLVHLCYALAVQLTRNHCVMHVSPRPALGHATVFCVACAVTCFRLMCGLLLASQEFETAAKEGRLEEALAEGAIEMTPEEVQQLKAREAADAAAATVTNAGPGPQVAGTDPTISQQRPASRGAAAAGATPAAEQQPQRAAVADPGQAQPVHSAPVVPEMSAAAGATPKAQQPQSAAVAEPSQVQAAHGAPPVPNRPTEAAPPADSPGSEAAGNATTADSRRSSQNPFVQPTNRFQYNPGSHNVPNMKRASATPSKRQQTSRHSMYQQPAGPQPPPGLLEREQFLSELRRRQQQEQQEAQAAAEQQQQLQQRQQQPLPDAESAAAASQPNSDAQEAFLAKYTFETLAMQREAQEAADVPVGPLGWQAELASVSHATAC